MLTPIIDAIFYFVGEIVLDKLFLGTGIVIIKVFTLGKYPVENLSIRKKGLLELIGFIF